MKKFCNCFWRKDPTLLLCWNSFIDMYWCLMSFKFDAQPFQVRMAWFLCNMRRRYVPHFVTKEQGCLEMFLKSWCDSLFNESSENWMGRAMWYETFIWYDKRLNLSFAGSPFEIHWPIISELSFLFWLFWIVYDTHSSGAFEMQFMCFTTKCNLFPVNALTLRSQFILHWL